MISNEMIVGWYKEAMQRLPLEDRPYIKALFEIALDAEGDSDQPKSKERLLIEFLETRKACGEVVAVSEEDAKKKVQEMIDRGEIEFGETVTTISSCVVGSSEVH